MACDQYYSSVVSLLHFDGTDGSTTFTDATGKTWTASGNAQIDTAQSKYGGASGLFDGTGDYVSTPDHGDFEFGAGDFTFETWVRFLGYPNNNTGVYVINLLGKEGSYQFYVQGSASAITSVSVGIYDTSWHYSGKSFSFSLHTWYHIAFVRQSGVLTTYVNGVVLGAPSAFVYSAADNANAVTVGGWPISGYNYYLNGYLDDLRITKGVARYTANFTPPTEAFAYVACNDLQGTVDAANDAAGTLTNDEPVKNLQGVVDASAGAAGTLDKAIGLSGDADSTATVSAIGVLPQSGQADAAGDASGEIMETLAEGVGASPEVDGTLTFIKWLDGGIAAEAEVGGALAKTIEPTGAVDAQTGVSGAAGQHLAASVDAEPDANAPMSPVKQLSGAFGADADISGHGEQLPAGSGDSAADLAGAQAKSIAADVAAQPDAASGCPDVAKDLSGAVDVAAEVGGFIAESRKPSTPLHVLSARPRVWKIGRPARAWVVSSRKRVWRIAA